MNVSLCNCTGSVVAGCHDDDSTVWQPASVAVWTLLTSRHVI